MEPETLRVGPIPGEERAGTSLAGVDHRPSDFAPLLELAFDLNSVEEDYEIVSADGDSPTDVEGVWYQNGPAITRDQRLSYRHWLDGDGFVTALHFEKERIRYRSRFVGTAKRSIELSEGRPVFRTFGTSFPGDQLRGGVVLQSPANVSVQVFDGRLLAFGEQGVPYQLSPELDTTGPCTFHGAINEVSPFAAHARIDQRTGELFNFGISYAQDRPCLHFYGFNAQGKLAFRTRTQIEYAASVHDFALTSGHAIVYLSPYLLDMSVLRNGGTVMDALSWEPDRGARLIVLRRTDGALVHCVPLPGRYVLHCINSFEQDDSLILDVIELDRPVYDQYHPLPNLFVDAPRGRPVRLKLDLHSGACQPAATIGCEQCPDFPALYAPDAGGASDRFWMLAISATGNRGRKFFDLLVDCDWRRPDRPRVFQAPEHWYFSGEPVLMSAPSRMMLASQVFDAGRRRSGLAIFDAEDIPSGPVTVVWMRRPVRLGFHSVFVQ